MGQPQQEIVPMRPKYNTDRNMYGIGGDLQYNQPSMNQIGPNGTIKRLFL